MVPGRCGPLRLASGLSLSKPVETTRTGNGSAPLGSERNRNLPRCNAPFWTRIHAPGARIKRFGRRDLRDLFQAAGGVAFIENRLSAASARGILKAQISAAPAVASGLLVRNTTYVSAYILFLARQPLGTFPSVEKCIDESADKTNFSEVRLVRRYSRAFRVCYFSKLTLGIV